MQAAQALAHEYKLVAVVGNEEFAVINSDDEVLVGCPMKLSAAHAAIYHGDPEFSELVAGAEAAAIENPPELKDGVPINGAQAYAAGFSAADCPFFSDAESEGEIDQTEYEQFLRWNKEWDEAADAAEPAEKTGSIVRGKYRAIYAEQGHPTHCGDWLAEFLNERCLTGKGTDLERFESILNANGISMDKYKRSGHGWQGRFRMTGRNLLKAKIVRDGFILVPNMDGLNDRYEVPREFITEKGPKQNGTKNAQSAEGNEERHDA
jgi:hypothetical protein